MDKKTTTHPTHTQLIHGVKEKEVPTDNMKVAYPISLIYQHIIHAN